MFTIAPVASPIHDEASLERLVDAYRPAFESIGGSLDETDGPTLPFVLTGGTEAQILERWDVDEPLFLIAHPDQNSLPSSLEALARVGQLGGRGRILYLSGVDDRNGLDEIASAVHDLSVYRQMRRQTIGVVGPPSDWLVASMPSAEILKSSWGPTAVPIGLDQLYGAYTTDPGIEPIPAGETLIEIGEVAKADGIYKGLRELIAGENLDALSLRCFDVIGELDTTGCLALARLNDEGPIAGCEGDLVSTVTMMWVRELLGEVAWMANPSRVDPAENTLWLAHCTVPPSLVSNPDSTPTTSQIAASACTATSQGGRSRSFESAAIGWNVSGSPKVRSSDRATSRICVAHRSRFASKTAPPIGCSAIHSATTS